LVDNESQQIAKQSEPGDQEKAGQSLQLALILGMAAGAQSDGHTQSDKQRDAEYGDHNALTQKGVAQDDERRDGGAPKQKRIVIFSGLAVAFPALAMPSALSA
jgi:hypothetical protein